MLKKGLIGILFLIFFVQLTSSLCSDYGGFVPDTLGDTTLEVINYPYFLQDFLDYHGYALNATTNQSQIQVWQATNNVKLNFTYSQSNSSYSHVFGYYNKSNPNSFIPILKDDVNTPYPGVPVAIDGQSFIVNISQGQEIGFEIKSYDDNGVLLATYFSENALNLDPPIGKDRFIVYDLCNEFVITPEDAWSDFDYFDIPVIIRRISNEVSIPNIGSCNYNATILEACEYGNGTYTAMFRGVWTWATTYNSSMECDNAQYSDCYQDILGDGKWHYDPTSGGEKATCEIENTKTMKCPIALPFFTPLNLLITLLTIAAIYGLLSLDRKK